MHKFVALTAVVLLAASSVNCARSSSGTASSNILAPSASDGAAPVDAAGKGRKPGGGGGSLTLVMVNDANGNGLPNWGDRITFGISTTATTEPNVSVTCTQNGVVVYGAVAGFYVGYPWPWNQVMTLSSNAWQGGAADCVAKLYYFSGTSTIYLSSMNFPVYE